MNYLQQIVAFGEYKSINQLSTGQIALWYALMDINNKCGWIEWFSAPNKVLEFRTGLSQTGVYNARKVLKENGLIDYKFNGEKATNYKMIPITLFNNSDRGATMGITMGATMDTNRDTTTLNKQNKTKQNKNYYNKNSIRKSPLNNYDDENADDYKELEDSIIEKMLSDEY